MSISKIKVKSKVIKYPDGRKNIVIKIPTLKVASKSKLKQYLPWYGYVRKNK